MNTVVATLLIIALTFVPALELRASIPVGILHQRVDVPLLGSIGGLGLSPLYVFFVATITNIALGILLYIVVDWLVARIRPHWAWFDRFYRQQLLRAQKKVHKKVERYGWLGLALFIAIPLPGSGVYTGTLAAYALGIDFHRFAKACIVGCAVAGWAVTALTLLAL